MNKKELIIQRTLGTLLKRNSGCTDCPLHKGAKTVCLWGDGPTNADIMFIGRDPGSNEDVLGKPFVGKAGHMLDQLLAVGNIDRSKVYISNIVRCRPPDNRQPTKEEKAACFKYLKAEINTVQPKMIVTLGGDALEAITGQSKVTKYAGSVINVTKESLDWQGKVYATLHPSYLLRDVSYIPRAEKHFRDIGHYFRGEDLPKLSTRYIYTTEWDQVEKLFDRLNTQTLVAFDTETDSLDFTKGEILCFSFSWKECTGVMLPLVGYRKEEIWTPEQKKQILKRLKDVFANKKISWIAHNMSFDHKYLMASGIDIAGPLHDTMLLQHLLDENAKDIKGLKALAMLYTDMGRYDDPLDECIRNLKIEKSKNLKSEKDKIKKLIKIVEKIPNKLPEDVENLRVLTEKFNILESTSIDVPYSEVPVEILWPYAAMDADATIRIFNHHIKELRKHSSYYSNHPSNPMPLEMNLNRLYHKLIMPLRRVLDEMEFLGVKMDINYLHVLDAKYTKRIAELTNDINNMPEIKGVETRLLKKSREKSAKKWKTLKSVQEWLKYKELQKTNSWPIDKKPPRTPKFLNAEDYGIHYGKSVPFNMNSPAHLRILLFEELGCSTKGAEFTDKGALSTKSDVLNKYTDEPGVSLLLENRAIVKLHNTYVKGSLAKLTDTDRIHTNFNQHVTTTGRLSSSNPNLQNIPRENKDIKRAFIPQNGWVMLQLDFLQAEFRMWGQLSNDLDMLADIAAGLDIHTQTASDFWSIPMDQVTKQQRSAAKFVVFGLMYGRGAKSVAKQVGTISEQEAEVIKNKFFNRYPVAAKWLADIKTRVKKDLFVPGHFGRIRRLPHATSFEAEKVAEAQRQAVNSPIQGSAADVTGIGLIRIRKMLHDTGLNKYAHLLLTVHDSIVLEVDPAKLSEVIFNCVHSMTHELPGIRVQMGVDPEVGKTWADVEKYEIEVS